jgi:defect-in-organelle-trafficking protein DotD
MFFGETMIKHKILTGSLLAALALTGCALPPKVDQQLVAEPDPVALRLAAAVDKASSALQTLASVEQARNPGVSVPSIPYAPQELRRSVSVQWVGPVEPLAQRLADRAGYQFQVQGDVPPVPLVVSVEARQKPLVEVLRDVGLQAGQRADVSIDPERKIVELTYAPISGD